MFTGVSSSEPFGPVRHLAQVAPCAGTVYAVPASDSMGHEAHTPDT